MENTLYLIQQIFGIRAFTLFAGLAGCAVIFFKNSSGSLQARAIGFLTAIFSVIFFVPFLIHIVTLKFGIEMLSPTENILAFVFGLFSQSITENLIDDPVGTLNKTVMLSKRLKAVVFNSEVTPKSLEEKGGKNE